MVILGQEETSSLLNLTAVRERVNQLFYGSPTGVLEREREKKKKRGGELIQNYNLSTTET